LKYFSVDLFIRNAVMLFICVLIQPVIGNAATMTIINADGSAEGFNDPSPFTPVGGNNATTLGQARLNAFQHAADIWGALIESPVPIEIRANMDPLGGSASGATLGQAGTATAVDSFSGAPLTATTYPIALANALAGLDLVPAGNVSGPASEDIDAQFNSDVDGNIVLGSIHWYYGFDGNPPINPQTGQQDEDFVSVVLHELGHGLGFNAEVNIDAVTGVVKKIGGLDGAFMRNVEHHGAVPAQFPAMTDSQRFAAVTSVNALHFIGVKTVAARGGHAELFAPATVQPGSTLSHFDENTLPNELMSPFSSGPQHHVGLALQVMQDMGWRLLGPSPPSISGPALIGLNATNNYAISPVTSATSYEWESASRTTTIVPEGGENGLTPWQVAISPGYSLIDNQISATGGNSLHLAMPLQADQVITLKRQFRPGSNSQLLFQSRLGFASTSQVARVQLSADSGLSWHDIWTLAGDGAAGQLVFSLQSVSLAAYAGQRIQLRFNYNNAPPGSIFPQVTVDVGWHIDDILITNAEEYINQTPTSSNATVFAITPTAVGNLTLRARAMVAGQFTHWGADFDVNVSIGGPIVTLDVDGSGASNASDGVMILRKLNGGLTVTTGIVLPAGANNTTVVNAITNAGTGFDVDGDSDADANDAVMILRRLNGGQTVTTGVLLPVIMSTGRARSNLEITTVIDGLMK